MDDLITIVIPVYNVEDYVDKCLESVLAQTYKNIEIIIVNDGSTDNSLEKVNHRVKGDNRVRIFNKHNGGLSSARNLGIEKANGKYISFIDSDDWVDPQFIEKLHNSISRNNSDIAICNMTYIYPNGEIKSRTPKLKSYKTVSNEEGLIDLFNSNGFRFHAVNKLYDMKLFRNVEYPEGKIYEDVFTTYKLFLNSKMISYVPEDLYFYLQSRPNSILNTDFNVKRFNIYEALKQIKDTVRYYPSLTNPYINLVVANTISLCNYIYPIYNKDNRELIAKYYSIIKSNINFLIEKNNVYNNKDVSIIDKIRFSLIVNHFNSYLRLMKMIKMK